MTSKKTFVAIARAIASARDIPAPKEEALTGATRQDVWLNGAGQVSEDIALSLADFFAVDNPRFDRTRFLAACGVTV